jgi:hypothetical protein
MGAYFGPFFNSRMWDVCTHAFLSLPNGWALSCDTANLQIVPLPRETQSLNYSSSLFTRGKMHLRSFRQLSAWLLPKRNLPIMYIDNFLGQQHSQSKEVPMYYSGIDLHSDNSYITTVDDNGSIVKQQRVENISEHILDYFHSLPRLSSGSR